MMDTSARANISQKKAILKSVGRLIRGLSALFWGLPVVLLSEAHTEIYARARELGVMLPLLTNAMMLYGLIQIRKFQPQERVWAKAVDRSLFIGLLNLGLVPFLFFWHDFPGVSFFDYSVGLLFICGLLYLHQFNFVLRRLSFMIPNETLRHDTELFTGLNRRMLSVMVVLVVLYQAAWLMGLDRLPIPVIILLRTVEALRPWLIVLMVVMPVAMTMTMLWKVKEILLDHVDEWAREIYSGTEI